MTDYADPVNNHRLIDKEAELRALILGMSMSEASRGLAAHPGWKQMMARIDEVYKNEIRKLESARMDAYELGHRQGALRVIRVVLSAKPMTDEELAIAADRATVLGEEIAELRKLLS